MRLLRQRIHQVQVEVAEPAAAQLLDRAQRVVRAYGSARAARARAATKLCAPRDTRLMPASRIAREAAALDGAGIGLQSDLGIARELDALPQRLEQARIVLGREQARRAAAEEHACRCGGPR